MDIGTLTAPSGATLSGATASAKNSLDKDGFLKLLVAQLRNQDPTGSGLDPNQMIQQLTSFSALEQAQQTNASLATLQTQTSALFQAQSASLVGKTAQVAGSGFTLSGGAASQAITLPRAATVTLTVKDASGNVVAMRSEGHLEAGTHTLTWDGKDAQGRALPEGTYTTELQATGDDGQAVTPTTSLRLKVEGVAFRADGVYLLSGGQSYALANVLQINA